MFELFLKQGGASLGKVEDADLQALGDKASGSGCTLDPDTIEALMDGGASPALLKIVMEAIGTADAVEIGWKKV